MVHDFVLVILPTKAVVRADAHGIHQTDRAAERAHVLTDIAAGEEDVRPGRFAQQLQAAAECLDVGRVRIVERLVIADVVVLVTVVDVNLFGHGAGPEAVQLEIIEAPPAQRPRQLSEMRLDLRMRQVQ